MTLRSRHILHLPINENRYRVAIYYICWPAKKCPFSFVYFFVVYYYLGRLYTYTYTYNCQGLYASWKHPFPRSRKLSSQHRIKALVRDGLGVDSPWMGPGPPTKFTLSPLNGQGVNGILFRLCQWALMKDCLFTSSWFRQFWHTTNNILTKWELGSKSAFCRSRNSIFTKQVGTPTLPTAIRLKSSSSMRATLVFNLFFKWNNVGFQSLSHL
jgi:hypothetical protein